MNTKRTEKGWELNCAVCKYNSFLFKMQKPECLEGDCSECENANSRGECRCNSCYDEDSGIYIYFEWHEEFRACLS